VKLEELLELHSKEVAADLQLNNDGICHIVVEDVTLSLEEGEEDTIFLYTQIARLPDVDNEAIYCRLLQANLYGAETDGAVFALDHTGTQVILFHRFTSDALEFSSYLTLFNQFVEQTRYWIDNWDQLIQELGKASDKEDATGESYPRIKP